MVSFNFTSLDEYLAYGVLPQDKSLCVVSKQSFVGEIMELNAKKVGDVSDLSKSSSIIVVPTELAELCFKRYGENQSITKRSFANIIVILPRLRIFALKK